MQGPLGADRLARAVLSLTFSGPMGWAALVELVARAPRPGADVDQLGRALGVDRAALRAQAQALLREGMLHESLALREGQHKKEFTGHVWNLAPIDAPEVDTVPTSRLGAVCFKNLARGAHTHTHTYIKEGEGGIVSFGWLPCGAMPFAEIPCGVTPLPHHGPCDARWLFPGMFAEGYHGGVGGTVRPRGDGL